MQEQIHSLRQQVKDGEALFIDGKVEQATRCFQDVLRIDSENIQAMNNLAVIAHGKGQTDEALRHLTRALDLNPFDSDVCDNVISIVNTSTDMLDKTPAHYWPYLLAQFDKDHLSRDDLVLLRLAIDRLSDRQKTRLLEVLLDSRPKGVDEVIPQLLAELSEMPHYLAVRVDEWLHTTSPQITTGKQIESAVKTGPDPLSGAKVLHGSCEIANQMRTTAQALGKLGVYARTLTFYPNYLKYESDYVVDVEAYRDDHRALSETRKLATKLITEYDIFHFHFGTTLTLDHSDLPVLRQSGKKMVAHYWGGEVRVLSRAREINPYVRVKTTNEDAIRRQLQIMANYVPHCVVGDYELLEYIKDYFEQVHIIPPMIDLSKYRPVIRVPSNEKLHIVHAPTAPSVKGSQHIVQALNELSHRYDFRFTLVQGMSHEEAKKTYADADIIVDSIHCGTYGLLAIEGMAMGKAVMVGICDFMKNKYPAELPVIPVNPDTIKEQLRFALDNREILPELGIRGRRYVEKHHDMHKVVQQYVDLYQEL